MQVLTLWLLPGIEAKALEELSRQAARCGVTFDMHALTEARLRGSAALAIAGLVGVAGLRCGELVFCWVDGKGLGEAHVRQALNPLGLEQLIPSCLDFFSWPCSPTELQVRLNRLIGEQAEVASTSPPDQGALDGLGLVGRSRAFLNACQLAARLSRYEVPVLIEGETGTGKELFARALHYLGPRARRPFIPINCGALPDALFENELFGHTSGAYTDAKGDGVGLVAQAEGGTLFFDEVHCLTAKGQVALLRFLQDQSYRPLGASASRRADVRIVAATNCRLAERVAADRFREDLHYRLNVTQLALPPLRDRREDIPMIASTVVARLCARYGQGPRRFTAASLAWLASQPWRGNVRELENFIHRAFVTTDSPLLQIDTLAPEEAPRANRQSFNRARAEALAEFEMRYVKTLLSETHGNVSEAARHAQKDRRVFGRLIKKHKIDRGEFGAA